MPQSLDSLKAFCITEKGLRKPPLPTLRRWTDSCGQAQGFSKDHSVLGPQGEDAEEGNNAAESWDLLTVLRLFPLPHAKVEKLELDKFAPAALTRSQEPPVFEWLHVGM